MASVATPAPGRREAENARRFLSAIVIVDIVAAEQLGFDYVVVANVVRRGVSLHFESRYDHSFLVQ